MRTIFSIRFVAAIGAVVGLFALLTLVFGGGPSVADRIERPVIERHVDLVEQVYIPVSRDFEMLPDGTTDGELDLVLDADRTVHVVPGTYGEVECDDMRTVGACAVLADLLGDAVVWFALLPVTASRTVELPAIDVLEDGRAHLVNGWSVRYARVLDRRCDQDFASYQELRREVGTSFVSIYSLDDDELIAVRCTG